MRLWDAISRIEGGETIPGVHVLARLWTTGPSILTWKSCDRN